jgi:asparagine synthase (glutamine-hydrolysing)
MCGIGGIVSTRPIQADRLRRMAGSIAHRGPDDGGTWSDKQFGIGFAHARLAIVDLSPLGHQPMTSANGRYVMTFNGEIYNHRALRQELEAIGGAPQWRGHSDTESLIEAIAHWGLERALQKSTGMFAIALFDRATGKLALARDRFGEKPLYYGWIGGEFLFGSELKALVQVASV